MRLLNGAPRPIEPHGAFFLKIELRSRGRFHRSLVNGGGCAEWRGVTVVETQGQVEEKSRPAIIRIKSRMRNLLVYSWQYVWEI